jgi:hypothetical protein
MKRPYRLKEPFAKGEISERTHSLLRHCPSCLLSLFPTSCKMTQAIGGLEPVTDRLIRTPINEHEDTTLLSLSDDSPLH